MWEYPAPSAQPLSIAVDGLGRPYLYVAEKEGGVAVLDISSQGVRPTRAGGVTLGDDLVYVTYIRAPIPFRGTWSGMRGLLATPAMKNDGG
ncbi:MAG: hypothetical protein ABR527_08180 [Gemmatimonadota bacterium]